MPNAHRRFLTAQQIQAVLQSSGITAPLLDHAVMEGGTFNTVYRLTFADRPGVVLKLAPDPQGSVMTYEHGLVGTEAEFYGLARTRGGLPVPQVIALHDLGPELGGGQALLVSELAGIPWTNADVPDESRGPLRTRLGELVAALHGVTGSAFGYPSASTGPLTSRWDHAFTAMMHAVLDDAARFGVDTSVAPERVVAALEAAAPDLASVRVPSLVHFDLWEGNVLLDVGDDPAGDPTISGIIDGERAIWADPVMEFASAALFGEIRDDANFIRGYERAGAILPLDASARRRLLLYRVYLDLIMSVEPVPRGYDGDARTDFDRTVTAHLQADLAELEHLPGS